MNKLSIKRGLKFFHILVLHIPTVESYRKTLSDRSTSCAGGPDLIKTQSTVSRPIQLRGRAFGSKSTYGFVAHMHEIGYKNYPLKIHYINRID